VLNLAQWGHRDLARDKAAARQAASMAVGAVDSMLRTLYLIRGRLVREISPAGK
jgi:hypothetical protein